MLTVRYLGNPDMGVIWSGYFGALLIAGAYSVGRLGDVGTDAQPGDRFRAWGGWCVSSLPPRPIRWSPTSLTETRRLMADIARRFAIVDRYQDFTRGIVSLRDVIFFATFIGFWST